MSIFSTDWFWSIFTMPIGLGVCFMPAVFVWLTGNYDKSDD